jgi:hypothetical protein
MPGDGFSWSVLADSCMRGTVLSFLETGRSHPASSHFLPTPVWTARPDATNHAGAPHLLAVHALGHAMLAELCTDNGLIPAGRVPRLEPQDDDDETSAAVTPVEAYTPPRLQTTPAAAKVRTPPCPDTAPVNRRIWRRPDAGCGGGGARVVWTGSRAAKTTAALSELDVSATGLVAEDAADAYGEVKQLVDALSPMLEQRLREGPGFVSPTGSKREIPALKQAAPAAHNVVVCPGFVATDIAPYFMKLALPLLEVLRPHICGQQLTVRRGIQPHLAAVLADDSDCNPSHKLICHRGMVTAPCNGFVEPDSANQLAAVDVVEGWLRKWRLSNPAE